VDDTKIYDAFNSVEGIEIYIQTYVIWCHGSIEWQMVFNIDKCIWDIINPHADC